MSFRFTKDLVLKIKQIKFYSARRNKYGFQVLWRPESQSEGIRETEKYIEDADGWHTGPWGCGVDVEGKRHEDNIDCANAVYDDVSGLVCILKERRKLAHRLNTIKWTPTLLDFFWHNGVRREEFEFLETVGLIYSYRYFCLSNKSMLLWVLLT